MKKLLIIIFWLPIVAFGQLTTDQQNQIDSLKQVIESAPHDSVIVRAYVLWDDLIYVSDPELDLVLNQKIEALCRQNLQGNLTNKERTIFQEYLAYALNNMGIIVEQRGDYALAITYYSECISLAKSVADVMMESNAYSNLGMVYHAQEQYDEAIKYYTLGYEMVKGMNDTFSEAASLNNIGLVYADQHQFEEALTYYYQSLEMREAINDQFSIATSYGNIGVVLAEQGKYEEAIDYYNKSLAIKRVIGDKTGVANTLNNMGVCYKYQNNYYKAIEYCSQALALAQEVNAIVISRNAAGSLYEYYETVGQLELAYEHYKLYVLLRDSIKNDENRNELIRQEFRFDYEKKHLADSLGFIQQQELDKISHEAELEKEAQQRYVLYGGLCVVLVFALFILNRFRVTAKQKGIIEEQKYLVEQKNREITDSITYAKRIQEAILPPQSTLNKALPNGFVLYKPKDVVAGDFYWLHMLPEPNGWDVNGDTVLLAAADCTGHGVPGAMVSVVCSGALDRCVQEFGITEPGKMLDKTMDLVVQTFEESEEEVKDGMDIALCSLTGTTLHYAGAHNPLWIVRDCQAEPVEALNNPNVSVFRQAQDDTQCIIEIKATKQPIGKVDNPQPFQTHTIELQPNDTFYIFSDGFVDQFGGQKGKKFKAKAFRELLLSIQDKDMQQQRTAINEAFEQWRGDLEQVDDVCIIGVRIANVAGHSARSAEEARRRELDEGGVKA